MSTPSLHINCDVGESWYDTRVGNDEAVIPLVNAINVACGAHGGDPETMRHAMLLSIRYGVSVGAHPSYPDREGFGRRYIPMKTDELEATIKHQILVVKSILESLGGHLAHVKAHGALYNRAAIDRREADAFVRAVSAVDRRLIIVTQAGSELEDASLAKGLPVCREAFADRAYTAEGRLVSRDIPGAVIDDPVVAVEQVRLLLSGRVATIDGGIIPLESDTICVHGDHPSAEQILISLRHAFG